MFFGPYTMVAGVIRELEELRNDPTVFAQWFDQIEWLAESVGQTIMTPRVTGQQVHRANYVNRDPKEYYRVSVHNLFLDHVISHMHDRFGAAQQQSAKLLLLIPSMAATLGRAERDTLIKDLAKIFLTDKPAPEEHLLQDEAERWSRKWTSTSTEQRPNDLAASLRSCDRDSFPNINVLLRIACTMPVTTAESERANSALKFIKTLLRNRTGDDRLSSLVLLRMHGDQAP